MRVPEKVPRRRATAEPIPTAADDSQLHVSSDMLEALRQRNMALSEELRMAEESVMAAQRKAELVRDRYRVFAKQLDDVCSALGIPVSDVRGAGERNDVHVTAGAGAHSHKGAIVNPIALPCRPQTQRWYAGQALHQLGGEASISVIADTMRELGYEHQHTPSRRHQLEQSLAALPSQVDWIVASSRPGCLRLLQAAQHAAGDLAR